jgi:hypothetical protein
MRAICTRRWNAAYSPKGAAMRWCCEAIFWWTDTTATVFARSTESPSIPYKTFQSMDDVQLWMIDNHLGRRSGWDFQRGVLALRKKEIVSARLAQAQAQQSSAQSAAADVAAQSVARPATLHLINLQFTA